MFAAGLRSDPLRELMIALIAYLFNVTSTLVSLVTTRGVRRKIQEKSRATLGYKNRLQVITENR